MKMVELGRASAATRDQFINGQILDNDVCEFNGVFYSLTSDPGTPAPCT